MGDREHGTYRTISFDYTLPPGVSWQEFEDKVGDWFFAAAEEAGGQCQGGESGPYEALDEQEAELETLRGIARRVADGWLANGVLFNGWMRPTGGGPPYEVEPMTAAEVKAIFSRQDERIWLLTGDGDVEAMTEAEVKAIFSRQEEESDGE